MQICKNDASRSIVCSIVIRIILTRSGRRELFNWINCSSKWKVNCIENVLLWSLNPSVSRSKTMNCLVATQNRNHLKSFTQTKTTTFVFYSCRLISICHQGFIILHVRAGSHWTHLSLNVYLDWCENGSDVRKEIRQVASLIVIRVVFNYMCIDVAIRRRRTSYFLFFFFFFGVISNWTKHLRDKQS